MGFRFIDADGVEQVIEDQSTLARFIADGILTATMLVRADADRGWRQAADHPIYQEIEARVRASVGTPPFEVATNDAPSPAAHRNLEPSGSAAASVRAASVASALLRLRWQRFLWTKWLLLAGLALAIAGTAQQLWAVSHLISIVDDYGFGHVPLNELPDQRGPDLLGQNLRLAALALLWTLFFLGLYGARQLMQGCGVRRMRYGFGWTVGSLFVPFWNFVRPWQGMDEIRRAALDAAALSDRSEVGGTGRGPTNATVGLWLALNLSMAANVAMTLWSRAAAHHPPSATGFYTDLERTRLLLLGTSVTFAVVALGFFAYLAGLQRGVRTLLLLNRQDALPTDAG